MRLLYSSLVRLHPAEFRHAFGEQMLSIYDDISADRSAGIHVYFDILRSLLRQWFLRYGLWKPLLSVSVSALLFFGFPWWHPPVRAWAVPRNPGNELPLDDLVRITLLAIALIGIILVAIVSWSRAVTSRRSASCHWNYARSRSVTAGLPLSRT